MKRIFLAFIVLALMAITFSAVSAGPCDSTGSNTTVPGHCDRDGTVVGHYTSVYAYDASGAWYWDLGDGRVQGTVGSVEELDQATLTRCDYIINYRADFGGDPFMDNGWIRNNVNCSGYGDNGQYNLLVVHRTDPRFREDGYDVGWGPDWRAPVYTWSGSGNVARPDHPVGN